MRRPYNTPFVSIPGNLSGSSFRPFGVVRPFGAIRDKGCGNRQFLRSS